MSYSSALSPVSLVGILQIKNAKVVIADGEGSKVFAFIRKGALLSVCAGGVWKRPSSAAAVRYIRSGCGFIACELHMSDSETRTRWDVDAERSNIHER